MTSKWRDGINGSMLMIIRHGALVARGGAGSINSNVSSAEAAAK